MICIVFILFFFFNQIKCFLFWVLLTIDLKSRLRCSNFAFSHSSRKWIGKGLLSKDGLVAILSDAHTLRVPFLYPSLSCFSAIGRQGGKQRISVGEGCEYKGTVMHEMMHALGFFHEQSRTDRDNYIMVLWWNIEPGNNHKLTLYCNLIYRNYFKVPIEHKQFCTDRTSYIMVECRTRQLS